MIGLVIPSLEYGGKYGILITVAGIFVGAYCLNLIDKLVPHLHKLAGVDDTESHRNEGLGKVLLFVMAIAIHNLPEGIAAGVGFGSGDTSQALMIAGGIALQNIPEGMVIIAPLLVAGVSVLRTFCIALSIGLLEVVGVWMGFALGTVSAAMLPVMLGFAGGAMLYVTSDEMIPILISGSVPVVTVCLVVLYKAAVAMIVGLAVDFVLRILNKKQDKINIDAICDEDNCHCERGILHSAVHHTLTISAFVLIITIVINALVFFIGEENLGAVMYNKPFVSHLIAAVFGLIPNCAASVALAGLCTEGLITAGTMMSGLFSGAGVGLLVLFRVNKQYKENLLIIGIIVACGIIFGMIGDLVFPAELFVK